MIDMTEQTLLWETMVETGVATDEELGLAIALMGNTLQTLEQVLYIRTGYRDLGQYMEAEVEQLGDWWE